MRFFVFVFPSPFHFREVLNALPSPKRSRKTSSVPCSYPFCNPDLDIDTRVDDFVSRLTLDECASLLNSESPAIEHLGVRYAFDSYLTTVPMTGEAIAFMVGDGGAVPQTGEICAGRISPCP